MVRIPKGKNTPLFLKSIGIFETDLNLAIDSMRERLAVEGWTMDEVKVLAAQLLREISLKDEQGNQVELD